MSDKEKIILEIASLSHDKWRSTVSPEDVEDHINNIDFDELPDDWKNENISSAEISLGQVVLQVKNEGEFDNNFIESSAKVLHQKWLERNKENIPYEVLTEKDKEKDRIFIKTAIEVYRKYSNN